MCNLIKTFNTAVAFLMLIACKNLTPEPFSEIKDSVLVSDTIQYHPVRVDQEGNILPWFSKNKGESYDSILALVWNFWKNIELDSNGVKYYLNHQVWKPEHDMRGLGGDQINMALSSWALYYAYTGDSTLISDMRYQADYYLAHSLSKPTDAWPNVPYPYNLTIHSGIYNGDMRDGVGSLQPDKAANFGYELVNLYKITSDTFYLNAAIRIADCLAMHVVEGDENNSPLPFRVNAQTGKTGRLLNNNMSGQAVALASYTSNWSGLLLLFDELAKLNAPNKNVYHNSFTMVLNWMKKYPLPLNKWGPFFEDIPGWSDTQTNAITFAWYILTHKQLFPNWATDVKGIIEWTHRELGNNEYSKYNVQVMNEQTVYRVPGNSHSSRQASVELMYCQQTGDTAWKANAIRTLNWATYTVDHDGKNCYIRDDIWLTDGYGDYVRHYLRAMAACPELAPINKNKLLYASSTVTYVKYEPSSIIIRTFDNEGILQLRLTTQPNITISNGNKSVKFNWQELRYGGLLTVEYKNCNQIEISLK